MSNEKIIISNAINQYLRLVESIKSDLRSEIDEYIEEKVKETFEKEKEVSQLNSD